MPTSSHEFLEDFLKKKKTHNPCTDSKVGGGGVQGIMLFSKGGPRPEISRRYCTCWTHPSLPPTP